MFVSSVLSLFLSFCLKSLLSPFNHITCSSLQLCFYCPALSEAGLPFRGTFFAFSFSSFHPVIPSFRNSVSFYACCSLECRSPGLCYALDNVLPFCFLPLSLLNMSLLFTCVPSHHLDTNVPFIMSRLQDLLLFPNLQVLYLGSNEIDSLKEIAKLAKLPKLNKLVLQNNPVCANKAYR